MTEQTSTAVDASEEEITLAKRPHDLFLYNLIGNHILTFVGTLGLATSWPEPMLIVPIVSFFTMYKIFTQGKRICASDEYSDYVKSHWELAMKRDIRFIMAFVFLGVLAFLGLMSIHFLGAMRELVFALIGGSCILPILVFTLVLIVLESDSLNLASKGLNAYDKIKASEHNPVTGE